MNSTGAPAPLARGRDEARERAAQRRALEVDVARLALERRAGEDAAREAAVARPGGEVVAAQLARRRRPARAADHRAGRSGRGPSRSPTGSKLRSAATKIGRKRNSRERHAERARAVGHVPVVDDDVLERDARGARRAPARRRSSRRCRPRGYSGQLRAVISTDAAARRREVDARPGLGARCGAASRPGRGGAARTGPGRAGCRRRGSRRARPGSRRASIASALAAAIWRSAEW